MGVFLVRQVDHDSGVEIARFVAPNFLANEGISHILRQLFPPYDAAMSFQIGVTGATTGYPNSRPNSGGGAAFGPTLTFAQCTAAGANEGGAYTHAMRTSFGYSRQTVAFTASLEADGGALISPEVEFPNNHSWTPQAAAAWDLPWTPEDVEQPPPEWTPKESWEPEVGYPWQRPRKRCGTDCDPYDPNDCLRPYMYQWDPSGELDWLCDFRKMGGLPITLTFLADSSRSKLVAAAGFRAPVLLRPGMSLLVRYQARIFGRITADFALRFAKYAFQKTGSRYTTIYCRPLLATAPAFHRRLTYADIAPFFDTHFAAVALTSWTFVPGPPVRVDSVTTPQWTNSSGAALGPFGGLAVYGLVGGSNELMWITPIDPLVSVPAGDVLRVPNKVRLVLESL